MTNRILDLAEDPARISLDLGRVRIERQGKEIIHIPVSHLSAVVCSQRQVTMTQALLAALSEQRVILVVANSRFQPVGMLLPLVGHSEQTARFQIQASAPLPLKKQLWKQIIMAKIDAQAEVLRRIHGDSYGVDQMRSRVRVGNATAMEASASRRYWGLLFKAGSFLRHSDEDWRNSLLDYGYAILRAIVARALCGSGLHPGLGIHHHNKYDPFPLANDLMEPFRPLVDQFVAEWAYGDPSKWVLNKESKSALLNHLTGRFEGAGESRTLFDWIERGAEQLARCFEKKKKEINFVGLSRTKCEGSHGWETSAE